MAFFNLDWEVWINILTLTRRKSGYYTLRLNPILLIWFL
ncbi:hypothetical protein D1AOALGA4SA_546 [Olavius algarvensis Delta 1 endosymbiont]|nr:hypothetical protein D1AOALGA4SA_546 [Olavius algarvensis Delta 1 endosymbiont]